MSPHAAPWTPSCTDSCKQCFPCPDFIFDIGILHPFASHITSSCLSFGQLAKVNQSNIGFSEGPIRIKRPSESGPRSKSNLYQLWPRPIPSKAFRSMVLSSDGSQISQGHVNWPHMPNNLPLKGNSSDPNLRCSFPILSMPSE